MSRKQQSTNKKITRQLAACLSVKRFSGSLLIITQFLFTAKCGANFCNLYWYVCVCACVYGFGSRVEFVVYHENKFGGPGSKSGYVKMRKDGSLNDNYSEKPC